MIGSGEPRPPDARDAASGDVALQVIRERHRHKQLLLERLNAERGRYERSALEDHIAAIEALIVGFKTRQLN